MNRARLVINALVTASGPLGLSAFFPPATTTYQVPATGGKISPTNVKVWPPHLPLTATWQDADFKLENVLRDSARPGEAVGLRMWCMKLLSRYQYISGGCISFSSSLALPLWPECPFFLLGLQSPTGLSTGSRPLSRNLDPELISCVNTGRSNTRFHQLYNGGNARGTFRDIDAARGASFLGLNDDIEWEYETVRKLMGEWFEKRWPKKAVWERGWKRNVDWVEGEGEEDEAFVAW